MKAKQLYKDRGEVQGRIAVQRTVMDTIVIFQHEIQCRQSHNIKNKRMQLRRALALALPTRLQSTKMTGSTAQGKRSLIPLRGICRDRYDAITQSILCRLEVRATYLTFKLYESPVFGLRRDTRSA